jgi:hypothetical protein
MPGHRRRSKNANPNSKDRNRFAASFLRPYFSVPSLDDIYIARQSDRKNPIRNSTLLCINFQPFHRVYIPGKSEEKTAGTFFAFFYFLDLQSRRLYDIMIVSR